MAIMVMPVHVMNIPTMAIMTVSAEVDTPPATEAVEVVQVHPPF